MRPQLTRSLATSLTSQGSSPLRIGPLEAYPERVLQFGEGNFLRAFVDWMINALNAQGLFQGRVVVVQPIAQGMVETLNAQEGLYTLLLRGLQQGEVVEQQELITAVSRGIDPYKDWPAFLATAEQLEMRVVISNTTEAGIAFVDEAMPHEGCPSSFPAKLTAWLYARYRHFSGAPERGMLILPCELIDRNGDQLRQTILQYAERWGLEGEFTSWVTTHNHFFNTLVDRIVTGYPRGEAEEIISRLGYEDRMFDTGEVFHLWVIEGDARYREELPFDRLGLDVIWTDDVQPYRDRKVRILNGAHTMTALAAYLAGCETVGEAVEDPLLGAYMRAGVYEEIIPTLTLPEADTRVFADAVFERFRNPFIQHQWLSIALNSVAKFSVRVLPSLLAYVEQRGAMPRVLTTSLAALIVFYRGTEMRDGVLYGTRGADAYPIRDDQAVLKSVSESWATYEYDGDLTVLCRRFLAKTGYWGQDLTAVPGLLECVTTTVSRMLDDGVKAALRDCVEVAQ